MASCGLIICVQSRRCRWWELPTDHRQMKQSETPGFSGALEARRRSTGHVAAQRHAGYHPASAGFTRGVVTQYEQDGRSVIRLRFECSPLAGDGSQIDLSRLPLYLNADSPLACALHRALTLGCSKSGFACRGGTSDTGRLFSPMGFGKDDPLWPKANRPSAATNYCWSISPSARSLCLSPLNGLENVAWPAGMSGFEIDVVLAGSWSHDLPFSTENIRLHYVPVINLFPLEADPLHLSPLEK